MIDVFWRSGVRRGRSLLAPAWDEVTPSRHAVNPSVGLISRIPAAEGREGVTSPQAYLRWSYSDGLLPTREIEVQVSDGFIVETAQRVMRFLRVQ